MVSNVNIVDFVNENKKPYKITKDIKMDFRYIPTDHVSISKQAIKEKNLP